MLSTLFLSSLSPGELTDLNDANFDAEQQERFFQSIIMERVQLFDWSVDEAFLNKLADPLGVKLLEL